MAIGEGDIGRPFLSGDVVRAAADMIADASAGRLIGRRHAVRTEPRQAEQAIDGVGAARSQKLAPGIGPPIFRRAGDERLVVRSQGRTGDRKSTRLNYSHYCASRMPSSA